MKTTRRTFLQTAPLAAAGPLLGPSLTAAEKPQPWYLGRCAAYQLPDVLREPSPMRLRRIETHTLNGHLAFVRVVADNAAEGWGQVSTYDADLSAQIVHRKIARHFLGQDPAGLDHLVDRAIEANYKYPWSFVCRALSGVETAIWDLLGRWKGQSVCELLGGRSRPFPVYGSSMSRTIKPKDEGERLRRLRDQFGYRAFKIRVGRVNGRDRDQWPGRTEQIIPEVRRAVGDSITLLADGNSGYSPSRAIQVGRLLETHGYAQFEEPCPYWELEWTAEVTGALQIPVSGGEQDNDLAQWRRMIHMRAVDIVQPDILYLGGVVRTLRVAAMAQEAGLRCVPHSANRALVTVASLHVMGALPNAGDYVEYSIEKTPWTDGLFDPPLKVEEGRVAIPAGPGWGVRLNPQVLAKCRLEVSEL